MFELIGITTTITDQANHLIEDNQASSYITFLGGYDAIGELLWDDIYYEAELNQHLVWYRTTLNKLGYFCQERNGVKARSFKIDFPVRIQVRQFTSDSAPVPTPSYNPGLRVYTWCKDEFHSERFNYSSFGFHHYSNGQNGEPLNPDGTVNTETGSFSSDYVEYAYHWYRKNRTLSWKRFSVRRYLQYLTWEPEQTDQFEKALVRFSAHSKIYPFKKYLFQWRFDLGYKVGRTYIVKNPVNPQLNINAETKDRIQLKIESILSPLKWKNLSWYLRVDVGYDYYNINYQKEMQRIQFGIIGKNYGS